MDAHIRKRMKEIGGKEVLFDVPMSQYTTVRIGGNVEALYRARDLNTLREMKAFLGEGSQHIKGNEGFSYG
jgi:hypothetical protein